MRVQTNKDFTKIGRVLENAERPRSYIVKIEGKTYERNRKHLRKVEDFQDEPPAHKHEANADEENGSEETDEETGVSGEEEEEIEEEPALERILRSRYGRVIKPNSKYKELRLYHLGL